MIDWSYDLLDDNEQVLLARLAVFAGGFDLAAIEAICGTEPLDVADVLDIITSLVEKSLLRVEDSDDGARYRMLETIRDYAREKLLLRDELAATAQRHCDHFLAMAKAAQPGTAGARAGRLDAPRRGRPRQLARRDIAHAGAGGDPVLAVKFAVALLGFWMLRGYAREGRNYVRLALERRGSRHPMSPTRMRCMSAPPSPTARAIMPKRRMLETCLALRRGLGKESTLPQRCRRCRSQAARW